jgi:translation initiation factor RLI1
VRMKQPYVIDRLCIGCGICENKCPLEGKSAVLVTRGSVTGE